MTTCVCVGQHVPEVQAPAVHHVLPLSWGGPNTPENKVVLCPTTHENVHKLLNAYVHAGGVPPWTTRRRFSAYARELAQRAWDQRPHGHRPAYTQPHAYEESSGHV